MSYENPDHAPNPVADETSATEDDGEQVRGSDPRKHFRDIEVTEAEKQEIEEERKRRLAPENRPENSEVDNTGKLDDAPVDDDDPEKLTGSDPRKHFRDIEVTEAEKQEIEEERKRRLAPENRPPNSEVDNTGRTFEDGQFKD